MKDLTIATKKAVHSVEVKTYFLYELYFDPPNEPKRWTDWSENVAFDGHLFEPIVIKHSGMRVAEDGKVESVSLTVGNIDEDRYVQQMIENYDIIGKLVKITQIFEGINDPISMTFKIMGAKATKGQVTFGLSLGFDFLLVKVPCRKIYQDYCQWPAFKKEGCQYVGLDEDCGMTWKDCVEKGNTLNFGGFPGIINDIFYF